MKDYITRGLRYPRKGYFNVPLHNFLGLTLSTLGLLALKRANIFWGPPKINLQALGLLIGLKMDTMTTVLKAIHDWGHQIKSLFIQAVAISTNKKVRIISLDVQNTTFIVNESDLPENKCIYLTNEFSIHWIKQTKLVLIVWIFLFQSYGYYGHLNYE